jgi:single-strand DNA-binding protein
MYSLNRATLIGNITRDPELRNTPNGQTVTSFSIATNRRWKNQATNEFQEATEYHDVVAWGKAAEFIANFMKKGNKIYIDGRLQTRGWETPDGVKQRRTEVIVENFVPLTPKGSPGASMEGGSFDSLSDLGGGGDDSSQSAPPPAMDQTADASAPKKGAKKAPAEDEINLEDIPF